VRLRTALAGLRPDNTVAKAKKKHAARMVA
jgi:hypothetical protein